MQQSKALTVQARMCSFRLTLHNSRTPNSLFHEVTSGGAYNQIEHIFRKKTNCFRKTSFRYH